LQPKGEADIDLAVVGPMARSARDLRLALSVTTGQSFDDPQGTTRLNGLKIALWLDEPRFVLDPEIRSVVNAFGRALEAAGAAVTRVASPISVDMLISTYATLVLSLMSADFPWTQRLLFEVARGPALLARALGAAPISWAHGVIAYSARHRDWLQADEVRARLKREIAPIGFVAPFPHDHRLLNLRRLALSDGRRVGHVKLLDWIALVACNGGAGWLHGGGTARRGADHRPGRR
jgi:amidase